MRALAAALLCVALGACSSHQVTLRDGVDPSTVSPVFSHEVEVLEAMPSDRELEEIADVEYRRRSMVAETTYAFAVENLRRQAASVGADALVIHDASTISAVGSTRGLRGTAIRYTD